MSGGESSRSGSYGMWTHPEVTRNDPRRSPVDGRADGWRRHGLRGRGALRELGGLLRTAAGGALAPRVELPGPAHAAARGQGSTGARRRLTNRRPEFQRKVSGGGPCRDTPSVGHSSLLLALLAAIAVIAPASAEARVYIVGYETSAGNPGTETAQREEDAAFEADYVYTTAVRGFAADLSADQVAELQADPDV